MAPRRLALIMVGTAIGAGLLGGWLAVRHGGEAVNNWMMAAQAVAGVFEIQWGLAYRHSDVRANRLIGPLGCLMLAGPIFHFLPNDMSLVIRVAAALVFWLVAAIWFARTRRSARSSAGPATSTTSSRRLRGGNRGPCPRRSSSSNRAFAAILRSTTVLQEEALGVFAGLGGTV